MASLAYSSEIIPIQGFAPTQIVEVADGAPVTFDYGTVFMNEGAGSFTISGSTAGFYLQANITLVGASGGTTLVPQGAGARFLVAGTYTV